MEKHKTRKELFIITDQWYSKRIRLRYAVDGRVMCITCGAWDYYTYMQAGHYISRDCHSLRYDDYNVHPQCQRCNCYNNGDVKAYRIYLLKKYGGKVIDYFERMKRKRIRYTKQDLIKKIETFKIEVRDLIKRTPVNDSA